METRAHGRAHGGTPTAATQSSRALAALRHFDPSTHGRNPTAVPDYPCDTLSRPSTAPHLPAATSRTFPPRRPAPSRRDAPHLPAAALSRGVASLRVHASPPFRRADTSQIASRHMNVQVPTHIQVLPSAAPTSTRPPHAQPPLGTSFSSSFFFPRREATIFFSPLRASAETAETFSPSHFRRRGKKSERRAPAVGGGQEGTVGRAMDATRLRKKNTNGGAANGTGVCVCVCVCRGPEGHASRRDGRMCREVTPT